MFDCFYNKTKFFFYFFFEWQILYIYKYKKEKREIGLQDKSTRGTQSTRKKREHKKTP
jgi:hypothetical protein